MTREGVNECRFQHLHAGMLIGDIDQVHARVSLFLVCPPSLQWCAGNSDLEHSACASYLFQQASQHNLDSLENFSCKHVSTAGRWQVKSIDLWIHEPKWQLRGNFTRQWNAPKITLWCAGWTKFTKCGPERWAQHRTTAAKNGIGQCYGQGLREQALLVVSKPVQRGHHATTYLNEPYGQSTWQVHSFVPWQSRERFPLRASPSY
mmetsp:Transcript_23325/g.53760  ORF Transcript_23325/g.53760 Transcript_23325/m.53760 type:complete len:205 (-) Transcript_23325:362-976(-)